MLLWVDTLRSTIQKTTRKDEVCGVHTAVAGNDRGAGISLYVDKEIAYDQMQADRNTANIRSFYSVTNNQRKALRRQQRTASQYITGRNNSTRNRWLFKTAASSTSFDSFTDVNCQRAFVAKRIIWLFSSAIQITIDVSKLPRLRPSLISQWPFGVLVRQAASSKYSIDAQPAQWRKQPLPSVNVSARGLSDPDRAAMPR
ncbi:hypothetical protein T02_13356 [Trichinella nativa]|uniref:Uncharacterized protein n=1 Tax=Trichinella nativa TaxID=6335 RepID=A0A0V1L7C6_9BILA|nr:hypothetical protein T02_13356 [Trichinella nativa]